MHDALQYCELLVNLMASDGNAGGTYVALRPMGLTFIIPLRNSMKVPLEAYFHR